MRACIVTGSRDGSWTRFGSAIEVAIATYDVVIEGGARGVDQMARQAAQRQSAKVWTIKADWGEYGKAAGPKRNQEMLDELLALRDHEGYEIAVLAFHEDLPNSKGTGDMVRRAKLAGVDVEVFA